MFPETRDFSHGVVHALIKDDLSNIHQRAIGLRIGGVLSDDEKDKLNLTDGQKIIEDIK